MSKKIVITILSVHLIACTPLKKPDLNKEQANTFHQMGNFTSKNADYVRAEDLYKKAYKLDPSKSKSLVSLAQVQTMMGKHDEAIATYNKVLQQDKNNTQAKQGLAIAYFSTGETLDAAEQWNSLLSQEPQNSNALNGLGLVMQQLHQYEKAQACFQVALKTAPNNSILINNLGLNMALQGEISQGIEQLQKAQKINANERLKNNIQLLQSIANKEVPLEALSDKLNAAFPKQKIAVSDEKANVLKQSANKWCSLG